MPPYSFGQCETPQPFLLRMRHQVDHLVLGEMPPLNHFAARLRRHVIPKEGPHFLAKRHFFLAKTQIHRILL